jgi:hypothetical protein
LGTDGQPKAAIKHALHHRKSPVSENCGLLDGNPAVNTDNVLSRLFKPNLLPGAVALQALNRRRRFFEHQFGRFVTVKVD